jgi:putative pyruvate formate lyase activating enzyme
MKNYEKIKRLYKLLSPCYLCPLNCGANRLYGQLGVCSAGTRIKISSAVIYKGEEPPLIGDKGSGAIFFSYCNLKCVYCQNYNFSQKGYGKFVSVEELSDIMLNLQAGGAVNINLITATHFLPQVISAVSLAKKKGLKIPIVYNTSGYESVSVLKLIDGFIDIYLTDFRYGTDLWGSRYSKAPSYSKIAASAVKEMYAQVGNLRVNKNGLAEKGLIVRHLLFPNGLHELEKVLKIIKRTIGTDVYFSLMSQYIPVYNAKNFKEISRKVTKKELIQASYLLRKYGFNNGWVQYL